jgi:hypothetical protein
MIYINSAIIFSKCRSDKTNRCVPGWPTVPSIIGPTLKFKTNFKETHLFCVCFKYILFREIVQWWMKLDAWTIKSVYIWYILHSNTFLHVLIICTYFYTCIHISIKKWIILWLHLLKRASICSLIPQMSGYRLREVYILIRKLKTTYMYIIQEQYTYLNLYLFSYCQVRLNSI